MSNAVDPVWLGKRLRAKREAEGLTLQEVSAQTGVSVPTLSRLERGAAKGMNSDTLVAVAAWVGVEVEMLKKVAPSVVRKGKTVESTPDIVALHLRADKNLDQTTASALANLFRSVYEQVRQQTKEKKE